jgi:hypothetical protein
VTDFDPAVTDSDPAVTDSTPVNFRVTLIPAVTDSNPVVTDSNPVNFRVTLTVRPPTFILSDFRDPYFRVTLSATKRY